MKNLAFVIWVMGFPLTLEITDYLLFLRDNKRSNIKHRTTFYWFTACVFTVVSFLVYER